MSKKKPELSREEFLKQFETKMNTAIERFKILEPKEGYFLSFSGGKDSQCIYHLAKQAGVKFDAHYTVTSVDPPELIHFIKDNYPDVIFDYPRYKDGSRANMWNLIVKAKIPPTRVARYCCQQLKENFGGGGRIVVTGVRWEESSKRRHNHDVLTLIGKPKTTQKIADDMGLEYRTPSTGSIVFGLDNDKSKRIVEQCYQDRKTRFNPIVDWTSDDVWHYLNNVARVPHCCLYDEGMTRIGCVGCPLISAKEQEKELNRWPKYKKLYLLAFDKMLKHREETGSVVSPHNKWTDAESVMEWWIHNGEKK